MRANIFDSMLSGCRLRDGLRLGTTVALAITAAVTIPTGGPVVWAFDATSTGRTITLPAVVDGLVHVIHNISTGTAVLTIADPSAVTVGKIGVGDAMLCICSNGGWYGFNFNSNLAAGYEGFYGATPIVQPSGASQNAFTDSSGGTASDTIAATVSQSIVLARHGLAELANSQEYQYLPGFAGSLMAINASVIVAATTGSKLATVTGRVNAGALGGGGVVSLTSANCTPIGARVSGTAVTGAKAFTAAQTVGYTVGSVTAFVEGSINIELQLRNDDMNAAIAKTAAFSNAMRTALVNLGLIKGSA